MPHPQIWVVVREGIARGWTPRADSTDRGRVRQPQGLLSWAVPIELTQNRAPAGLTTRGLSPWLRLGSWACFLSPNPPMDTVGRREDSGRGEGVRGAMIRARIRVDGRLAGGLQALLGALMGGYSGCGEGDGWIGHGKRRSRGPRWRELAGMFNWPDGGSVAGGGRPAREKNRRGRVLVVTICSPCLSG